MFRLHLKGLPMTILRSNFLVLAALAALPLSVPNVALAGSYKNPTEPATPIVYPNCPLGFEVIRRAAYIFKCRSVLAIPDLFGGPLPRGTCAPTEYWTSASKETVNYEDGSYTVITCRH
jgi:hypothetical protein